MSYPGQNTGYPGQQGGYPGYNNQQHHHPGSPGVGYPGQQQVGYPGQQGASPLGYPGQQAASYPGQNLGSTYPSLNNTQHHHQQQPQMAFTGAGSYNQQQFQQLQASQNRPNASPALDQTGGFGQLPQTAVNVPAPVAQPAPVVVNQVRAAPPQAQYPGMTNLASYAAAQYVSNLPTIHRSEATADPDKPFDVYEYMRGRGFSDDQVLAARHEHVDPEPDMCLADTELRDYGGNAIFVYYKFCKFIAFLIAFMFCLAVINYAIFASAEKPTFKEDPLKKTAWYSSFFISSYTAAQKSAWLGTTIVAIIAMFFACPCYYRYIGNFRFEDDSRSLAEVEEAAIAMGSADDAITRFNDDGTIDVSARYRSAGEAFIRRLVSLFVFACFIAIQVGASIGITRIEQTSTSSGPAFAIAIIAVVLNTIYNVCARQLTEFEKWQDVGGADKSLTLKLILFKLSNVIAVYGSKQYPIDRCVYDVVGEQFLSLLFVEIVLTVPGSLFGAAMLTRFHQTYAKLLGSINGDSMHMAQFEMAIEYLAVIYRFYLSCMALVVFPLSTVLGIVLNFSAFWAARYRMIKICSKPIRSTSTMRGTVTVVMILVFFATLFTPFAGAVWIMGNWASSETKTTRLCTIKA